MEEKKPEVFDHFDDKNASRQNKLMKVCFFFLILFLVSCKPLSEIPLEDSPAKENSTTKSPLPSPVPAVTTNESWTTQFMELVNNHRRSLGLRALIFSDEISEIARIHSEKMAKGFVSFGHTGFSLRCSQSYATLGGGSWCAENVAMGQHSPEAAYMAWMNSPGHRANIESARAETSGFGLARSSKGTYYWTEIFIQH